MKLDDCFQLGYVVKPHGLKGELVIFLDVDFPDDYQEMESLFLLRQNQLVPFFIEDLALTPGQKAIIKLEEISSREEADTLIGLQVFLPLDNLPALGDGQFYYHDVIGFSMYDGEMLIGEISSIQESGLQSLFAAQGESGQEILIPINDTFIKEIDYKGKRILLDLPAGLIDIFKDQSR